MTVRTLSSRTVYENPWMSLREDEIVWPDGSPGIHAVVDKLPGAVVLPWDGERWTLVGETKYPTATFSWTFPQGASDGDPAATPEQTARAELAEETGLRAGRLQHLGWGFFAPGMSSQRFDAWLATDLTPGEHDRSPSESGMTTRTATPSELEGLVRAGEVTDSATLAALSLLRIAGLEP